MTKNTLVIVACFIYSAATAQFNFSPVSLDYYDLAPFAFYGKIEKTHITYTK
jgi:hypothetical protein